MASTSSCAVRIVSAGLVCAGLLAQDESPTFKTNTNLVIVNLTVRDKSGKPIDMIFRVTDVWRKEKGGWKMIHSHISVPIDMASGKADLQSK